jgi:beta-glucuronidase
VQRVCVAIEGNEIDLETDANGVARAPLPFAPERWSPAHPRLYDVTLSCNGEIVRDRIGFRTIETRGCEILLNGEPVFLRGISIHEEARCGSRCGEDDARLLRWAQSWLHFVRLALPHDKPMARIADELDRRCKEIPVYWEIDWESVALESRRTSSRLILRDRNRASRRVSVALPRRCRSPRAQSSCVHSRRLRAARSTRSSAALLDALRRPSHAHRRSVGELVDVS